MPDWWRRFVFGFDIVVLRSILVVRDYGWFYFDVVFRQWVVVVLGVVCSGTLAVLVLLVVSARETERRHIVAI